MVEISEFVDHSIRQILSGVDRARRDALFGGEVAPSLTQATQIDPAYQVAWHDGHFWTPVHFDIAVTATTTVDDGGKVSFKLPIVELGLEAGGGRVRSTEGVSRVQFSVPLRLPKSAKTI